MISKILFENTKLGIFPYKNYNCSIIKLNKEETLKITNKSYNKESVLIIFFTASHPKKMGTMSFIGLISYEMLNLFLKDEDLVDYKNFWIIKPHLLQNDKGPKCADLRIFKMKNNIGVIGYSRLAPISNTKGIADYYVRASLLEKRINNNLYKNSDKLYHFYEIDGGCFPYKIGNNYKKFILKNDNCKINNVEFYIRDNEISKLVTPHKSKNKLMPNLLKLNGIEVSFSKTSTNEDPITHISTKNIIPIQIINPLDNICGFIDVTPPSSNNPKLTIQNIESGKVLFTNNLIINNSFKSKFYRGSTAFIELSNNMWITMVHERCQNKCLIYKYYYQIYDNKEIMVNDTKINIPNKCIKEILFDEKKISNKFIFITGMIIDKQLYIERHLKLKIILSYGISDMESGISVVELDVKTPVDLPTNNNLYYAHKSHFKKKNERELICSSNTFLKNSLKHSSELEENMKKKFNVGDKINIVNDFNDTYYLVSYLPKLHIIHRIDKTNTGDMVSNCSEYYLFKDYKIIKHDIYSPNFTVIKKNDPIILSGGGLLNCLENWNKNINKLLELSENVFGWGIGFNKHHNTHIKTKINLSKFKLLGIRDYKQSYESNTRYVPCSSCNLPQLKYEYKIKRNIGVIEHHHNKITLKVNYDKINNNINIDNLIQFIGESNIIITNTYHALYFSSLLNKKCILYNSFSEKFNYTKFKYVIYENNLVYNDIKTLNKDLLQNSIKINNLFYNDIKSLIE